MIASEMVITDNEDGSTEVRCKKCGRFWSISELAREIGISRTAMRYRLDNWDLDKALSVPNFHGGRSKTPGTRNGCRKMV